MGYEIKTGPIDNALEKVEAQVNTILQMQGVIYLDEVYELINKELGLPNNNPFEVKGSG